VPDMEVAPAEARQIPDRQGFPRRVGGAGMAAGRSAVYRMPAGRIQILASVAALVVVGLIFEVQTSSFLSSRNITELCLQSIQVGLMALGLIFVLLLGEIDLSVAALSAVCGTVTASAVVVHHINTAEGIGLGIAAGVAFELLQALLITIFGAPSFVVTLGGSLALSGVMLLILPPSEEISLGGTRLGSLAADFLPEGAAWLLLAAGLAVFIVLRALAYAETRRHSPASASLARMIVAPSACLAVLGVAALLLFNSYLGVPLFVAILIGLLAVSAYVTSQTRFGVHIYAVGGSRQAANRAGISPRRIVFAVFAINGGFAAAAGILGASRLLGIGVQTNSPDLLLVAIAAAVVGGTSLFGGRGNVWGALIGALLIETLANGLNLIGASAASQYIAEGAILGVAAIVDAAVNRRWIFSRTGE
jgi:D-xylose transport system permease protein